MTWRISGIESSIFPMRKFHLWSCLQQTEWTSHNIWEWCLWIPQSVSNTNRPVSILIMLGVIVSNEENMAPVWFGATLKNQINLQQDAAQSRLHFQQDAALVYMVYRTDWMLICAFGPKNFRSPQSPDLNFLDFRVCGCTLRKRLTRYARAIWMSWRLLGPKHSGRWRKASSERSARAADLDKSVLLSRKVATLNNLMCIGVNISYVTKVA